MAAQFEYDRHGFEGYLGNVGYKLMRAIVRSAHDTVHNLDAAYADMVHYVSG